MNNDSDPLTKLPTPRTGEPCQDLIAATHLVLSPACSLPKSAPTRYRKPGYMKQARENGLAVGFVSVTERKNVVDWLEGKIADHERILPLVVESSTPPGTPPGGSKALPTTPHRSNAATQSSPVQKTIFVKKIKQNEVELRDRNSVLRGIKPNNFSNIRQVYSDKLKKLKEASRSGSSSAAAVATPDAKSLARKARNNYPIIMISSSPTALVTMHNVKRFLQESTLPKTPANAPAAEGNPRPEDMIPIYRKRTSIDPSGKEHETQARYFVVDSVDALGKFGPDAWDRVVCVMTTGQAWQFRPYKWNEPIQLFHHVKGIYVSWSNEPPNMKIKDWNVTELKIDPLRRHVDKSVVAHFWKTLDTWTTANKPWLMKG
ncbi:RNA polymerase II-associated protein [Mycena alexandri]|uniref:RNA polymerase II-associated protein n=1 Tax=Mycena alexandri TaxID=1745969 RepID=A0AAD6WY34_9AGAR|nr:RNA polymerase II-associated protein [Mycena alexandri]